MMLELIKFTEYKSILCLNGDLPSTDFFKKYNQLPVIAADGAANILHQSQITANLVIGDLDSLHVDLHPIHQLLHHPEQDRSDFQKCLSYLHDNDLLPAIIVGINGGYLDHILNNINIFLETGSVLYAPPIIGFLLEEHDSKVLTLPKNSKISLMGMPQSKISSKGLKWELNETVLSFPGQTSCFNRSSKSPIQLHNHNGRTLVLIYETDCLDAGAPSP
jgi:thiamine pyrophosphokinase